MQLYLDKVKWPYHKTKAPGKRRGAGAGAGKKEDFLELFHHKGIDAGLAAGIFHQKLLTIRELKEYLNENGVEMRL